MTNKSDETITGMYDVFDALEAALKASDPKCREALAKAIDGFMKDFPDEFFWATGPQAPTLLYHLMMTIDVASEAAAPEKPRVIRIIDRKAH